MNLKMCTVGDLLKVIQEKYCLHETKQIFEDLKMLICSLRALNYLKFQLFKKKKKAQISC